MGQRIGRLIARRHDAMRESVGVEVDVRPFTNGMTPEELAAGKSRLAFLQQAVALEPLETAEQKVERCGSLRPRGWVDQGSPGQAYILAGNEHQPPMTPFEHVAQTTLSWWRRSVREAVVFRVWVQEDGLAKALKALWFLRIVPAITDDEWVDLASVTKPQS